MAVSDTAVSLRGATGGGFGCRLGQGAGKEKRLRRRKGEKFCRWCGLADAKALLGASVAKKKTGLSPGLVQQGGETARVASITGSLR